MKRKVGLVLGGGGGKGSYQVGVYKALKDHKLIKDIKGISGTSIGALNILLFANQDVETAERVWANLSRKDVLTTKRLRDYLKFSNFSLLSREGMLKIFKDNVNFDIVSKSKLELYVSVANVTEQKGEYFSLNNKSTEEIIDYISASSAIPAVFEKVKIGNCYYSDGFAYDNLPINILKEKGYNFLYVVPLSNLHEPNEETHKDITIINFKDDIFDKLGRIDGTFGFDGELSKERVELGYNNTTKLIEHLKKEGVIAQTFKEKLRRFFLKLRKKYNPKNYYSLKDIQEEIIVYDNSGNN
jgi:NTE family protein